MLEAMVGFLGKNAMTAYLCMMGVRLTELHRVLKPTGSLYLHCDPTASHYLKVLLDAVFGAGNFGNEISWRRSNPKSLNSKNFANCRDVILRYTSSSSSLFIPQYGAHDSDYVEKAYRYKDKDGRQYRLLPLLNPNDDRPNLTYEFLGVSRVWRWTRERMQQAYDDGIVVQLKPGAVPQYKKYLDESKGRTVTNDWSDLLPIGRREELGYPTQKPVALLERIINASSNEGDTVLDPFCGCGTTVHAAQKLNRTWIGIDVTHLAISLIETRLKDAFEGKAQFTVHGTPKDVSAARDFFDRDDRTKKEFEKWACGLVAAYPQGGGRKGADGGIDGTFWFGPGKSLKAIVSVKGGKNVGVAMIRELDAVVTREKADLGVFLTLEPPTRNMVAEARGMGTLDVEGFDPRARIQIVTIEDAIARGPASIDAPLRHGDTYKAAPAEKDSGAQGALDL
ncbi:DNA methyltransferase [Pseudaestuariivita sp.]|uniref:DNA methyltransferase n=1 Tax=Pseudaestuariivita sp. TaxID=2211669 RepID=UPI00405938C3